MKELRDLITEYEYEADHGRAQSDDVRPLLGRIQRILAEMGLEHCSHNMAFFGSTRYAKYFNPHLKRPIKTHEWDQLSNKQLREFDTLTDFPFKM